MMIAIFASRDSVQDEVAKLEKDLLAATDLRTDESKENLKDGPVGEIFHGEITWGNHFFRRDL